MCDIVDIEEPPVLRMRQPSLREDAAGVGVARTRREEDVGVGAGCEVQDDILFNCCHRWGLLGARKYRSESEVKWYT
jgi:hypothetical protein